MESRETERGLTGTGTGQYNLNFIDWQNESEFIHEHYQEIQDPSTADNVHLRALFERYHRIMEETGEFDEETFANYVDVNGEPEPKTQIGELLNGPQSENKQLKEMIAQLKNKKVILIYIILVV